MGLGIACKTIRRASTAYIALIAGSCLVACVGDVTSSDSANFAPGTEQSGADDPSDNNGPVAQAPTDSAKAQPAAQRTRRLTEEQYLNSVNDLLGLQPAADLPTDLHTAGFKVNTSESISEAGTEKFLLAAEDVATQFASLGIEALQCRAGEAQESCENRFIESLATRAYRRPLSPEDREPLFELFEWGKEQDGTAFGVQVVVEAVLQSPNFLYLDYSEAGALSNHGIAARLSYFLWNTLPDDELLRAADEGELIDEGGLETQVVRMLNDERFLNAVTYFHRQWLGLDATGIPKDANAFPDYERLKGPIDRETEDYLRWWLDAGDAKIATLLDAPVSLASDGVVELYGDPSSRSADGTVALDPELRRGILTQAAFLASHATDRNTSIVDRGLFLGSSLLCTVVPSPPSSVDTNPVKDPNLTQRQQLEDHQADPVCASCHTVIDPLGMAFEHYDAIGQYRTDEAAGPVDARVTLSSFGDVDGTYDGAIELVEAIASSDDVRDCYVKQWYRFAFGREIGGDEAAFIDEIQRAFAASDGDVKSLALAITQSPAFRTRVTGD